MGQVKYDTVLFSGGLASDNLRTKYSSRRLHVANQREEGARADDML